MVLRLAALLLLSTVAQAQFTLHTNHLKWSQARAFCQRQQGDLASIHSRAEQVTVAKLAGRYSVWIGFNDRVTEGQWKWSDNSPVVAYNWDVGEPNDYNNYEDCVQVKGFTMPVYRTDDQEETRGKAERVRRAGGASVLEYTV